MSAGLVHSLHGCTAACERSELTFPEYVGVLAALGIERYHADLLRSERTYYLAAGESHVVSTTFAVPPAPPEFDIGGLRQALSSVQAAQIDYAEFCRRILRAGCVGYVASILGRRVVYYGRDGGVWVERFPGSAS